MTRFLIAVPLLLVLLAACGGGSGTGSAAPGVTLEGTTWMLTHLSGDPATAPEGGTIPSLTFDAAAHRVAGSAGCNEVNASYTVDGGSLALGQVVSTRKACPDMFLETAFLGGLENTAAYRLDGHTLILSDANGTELLRFTDGAEESE